MIAALRAITLVTTRSLLGTKRLIGMGLFAMTPGTVLLVLSLTKSEPIDEAMLTGMVFTFLSVVVPIITIVTAAAALGRERSDQTLPFIAVRPISRYAIALAKVAAAVLATGAICAAGSIAIWLAGGADADTAGSLGAYFAGTAITIAAYCAIFVPLGLLAERATFIGLAYLVLWESATIGLLDGLAVLSPWRIGLSAVAAIDGDFLDTSQLTSALASVEVGAWGALFKVVVMVAIGIATTGWLLRKRVLR